MLTANEREWLVQRDAAQCMDGWYTCLWCAGHCTLRHDGECRLEERDWQDAAEFSERCAVWLAKRCAAIEKAVQQLLGTAEYKDLDAAAEILLEGARLTVEEEMDGSR